METRAGDGPTGHGCRTKDDWPKGGGGGKRRRVGFLHSLGCTAEAAFLPRGETRPRTKAIPLPSARSSLGCGGRRAGGGRHGIGRSGRAGEPTKQPTDVAPLRRAQANAGEPRETPLRKPRFRSSFSTGGGRVFHRLPGLPHTNCAIVTRGEVLLRSPPSERRGTGEPWLLLRAVLAGSISFPRSA